MSGLAFDDLANLVIVAKSEAESWLAQFVDPA